MHDLVHEVCDGKWIALGGGGYSPDIVGKSWTLYFSIMAEQKLPDAVPNEWIEKVKQLIGKKTTPQLRDEFNPWQRFDHDEIAVLDSQVEQIKERIPELGLPFYKK